MTSIEHDNDAGLAGVSAGCGRIGAGDPDERVTVTCAVIGLTNFGERPVPSTRLAEVLGRPVREAEAMARAVRLARHAGRGRAHHRQPRVRQVGCPALRPDR